MRQIEVDKGLRTRFPNRSEEFDDGVEVGIAAALMALGWAEFDRPVATGNLHQLRALASKLGYHLVAADLDDDRSTVTFRSGPPRARLQLVHSRREEDMGDHASSGLRRDASVLRLAPPAGARERADRSGQGAA